MRKNYIQKFDFFIDRKIDRKDFKEFLEDHFGGRYNFCYSYLSNSVKERKKKKKPKRNNLNQVVVSVPLNKSHKQIITFFFCYYRISLAPTIEIDWIQVV